LNTLKLYKPIGGGKERIIPPHSDVCTRLDAHSTLTHDNAPYAYDLTTILLHAQTFGMAITSIAATAGTFLMRHLKTSLNHNLIHLQARIPLSMTGTLPIPLARMILKDSNLGTFLLRDDRRQHLGFFDSGLTNLDLIAIGDQQYIL
jgi:hypothetical protein